MRELEPEAAGLPERYYMVYFSIQRYQEIRRNFGNDFDKNFHVSLLNLAGQISQVANHGVIVPDHVTNLVMVYETGPRTTRTRPWKASCVSAGVCSMPGRTT